MVVNIDDNPFENGREDEEEFKAIIIKEWTVFDGFKALPPPATLEDQYLRADPPTKKPCEVCGKDRVQTRCNDHLDAKGCNYCHLKKEHKG